MKKKSSPVTEYERTAWSSVLERKALKGSVRIPVIEETTVRRERRNQGNTDTVKTRKEILWCEMEARLEWAKTFS